MNRTNVTKHPCENKYTNFKDEQCSTCLIQPIEIDSITFSDVGDFRAINSAQDWLRSHGFSCGSMCNFMPIGILKGNWCIAKWRNLTPKERSQLHGKIVSQDFRNGPVTIQFKAKHRIDQVALFVSDIDIHFERAIEAQGEVS